MIYNRMTDEQLDRAIMYQVTDGRDLNALDNLLAERSSRARKAA